MNYTISRLEELSSAIPTLQCKPIAYVLAVLMVVLGTLYWRDSSSTPVLNAKGFFESYNGRAKMAFIGNARQMLHDWFEENPNRPVSLYTDTGLVMVLPGSMADEVRNDKRLHLRKQVEKGRIFVLPIYSLFLT